MCVIVIGQSILSSPDCVTTKWTCKLTQRDDENTTCYLFILLKSSRGTEMILGQVAQS